MNLELMRRRILRVHKPIGISSFKDTMLERKWATEREKAGQTTCSLIVFSFSKRSGLTHWPWRKGKRREGISSFNLAQLREHEQQKAEEISERERLEVLEVA